MMCKSPALGAEDDEEWERRYDRASEIACHPSRDDLSTRMMYSGEEARSCRRWTWREDWVGSVDK